MSEFERERDMAAAWARAEDRADAAEARVRAIAALLVRWRDEAQASVNCPEDDDWHRAYADAMRVCWRDLLEVLNKDACQLPPPSTPDAT